RAMIAQDRSKSFPPAAGPATASRGRGWRSGSKLCLGDHLPEPDVRLVVSARQTRQMTSHTPMAQRRNQAYDILAGFRALRRVRLLRCCLSRRLPGENLDERGALHLGSNERCTLQLCIDKGRSLELRPVEQRALQLCIDKGRALQLRSVKRCALQLRVVERCALQLRGSERQHLRRSK